MTSIDNKDEPQYIYDTNEQQHVMSEKGVRRVHMVASEHAQNVTVVACCNALGNSIPPIVLLRGQRLITFCDNSLHGPTDLYFLSLMEPSAI